MARAESLSIVKKCVKSCELIIKVGEYMSCMILQEFKFNLKQKTKKPHKNSCFCGIFESKVFSYFHAFYLRFRTDFSSDFQFIL